MADPADKPADLSNLEAINNLDTARMALRWALEKIRSMERDQALFQEELREREGRYNRLLKLTSLRPDELQRIGPAHIAEVVQREEEAARSQKALARRQAELEERQAHAAKEAQDVLARRQAELESEQALRLQAFEERKGRLGLQEREFEDRRKRFEQVQVEEGTLRQRAAELEEGRLRAELARQNAEQKAKLAGMEKDAAVFLLKEWEAKAEERILQSFDAEKAVPETILALQKQQQERLDASAAGWARESQELLALLRKREGDVLRLQRELNAVKDAAAIVVSLQDDISQEGLRAKMSAALEQARRAEDAESSWRKKAQDSFARVAELEKLLAAAQANAEAQMRRSFEMETAMPEKLLALQTEQQDRLQASAAAWEQERHASLMLLSERDALITRLQGELTATKDAGAQDEAAHEELRAKIGEAVELCRQAQQSEASWRQKAEDSVERAADLEGQLAARELKGEAQLPLSQHQARLKSAAAAWEQERQGVMQVLKECEETIQRLQGELTAAKTAAPVGGTRAMALDARERELSALAQRLAQEYREKQRDLEAIKKDLERELGQL
ncbi:MAG: hypothetical protein AAB320_06265 [Elusimicrobiota bacterium]